MGISILIAATKNLSQKYPAVFAEGGFTISTLLCLEAFLALLAGQNLLEIFRAELEALITLTNAVVAELNVAVAIANVAIEVTQSGINAVNALIGDAESIVNKFPFNDPNFLSCPLVQEIKNAITAYIPSTAGFFKAIKDGEHWILAQEYKLLRLNKAIIWYQQQIQYVEAFSIMLQAIVQAIDTQYPGGKPSSIS